MYKDAELVQVCIELESQETNIGWLQQHISEHQHKENDIIKMHKLEITTVKSMLSNNIEEIYRLKNHNKMLVGKIKKLKGTK